MSTTTADLTLPNGLKDRHFRFGAGSPATVECMHCGWTSRGTARTAMQQVFDRSSDHECAGVESYAAMRERDERELAAEKAATVQPERKWTTVNCLRWPVYVGPEIVGGGDDLELARAVAAQQSAERPVDVVAVCDPEGKVAVRYRNGAEIPVWKDSDRVHRPAWNWTGTVHTAVAEKNRYLVRWDHLLAEPLASGASWCVGDELTAVIADPDPDRR